MEKSKKIIYLIIEIILILLIIFSLALIVKWFINTRSNKKLLNEINTKLDIEEVRSGKNEIDYDYLLSINPDTVGYLIVENTSISYPVVKTNNNDYYLNHSFDKSNNVAGWIFMDYRNKSDDNNIIIYGHNMKDGSMFGKLKVLKNNNDHYISYYDNNVKYRYKVFSIYEVEAEDYYISPTFDNIGFINTLKSRSIYDYGYTPNIDDKIITLSTCSSNNKRLVVHAYKLN